MNETTDDHPAQRKKTPAWHWAVYAVLLATTIFATVLTYRKLFSGKWLTHGEPGAKRPPPEDKAAARLLRPEYDTGRLDRSKEDDFWTGQGAGPKDLRSLITRSIRAGTLETQDKDPGDLPPPTKSIRRGSWRQLSSMHVGQRAVYEYPGTLASGADHYVGMLLDKGFQCSDDSRTPGGPIKLHFIKGANHAFVVLKKHARDTTISSIIFILLTDRNSNGTVRQSAQED